MKNENVKAELYRLCESFIDYRFQTIQKTIDEIQIQRNLNTTELLTLVDVIHREVYEIRTKSSETAIQRHKLKTSVKSVNFSTDDYVLISKCKNTSENKLKLKWRGPQRIIHASSDNVFECQDFINEKVSLVHANRIKFFADSQLNITQELLDKINHNDPHYNTVTKFMT